MFHDTNTLVFFFPFRGEIPRYVCKTRARALHHRVPAYLGCLGSNQQRATLRRGSPATLRRRGGLFFAPRLLLRCRCEDVWDGGCLTKNQRCLDFCCLKIGTWMIAVGTICWVSWWKNRLGLNGLDASKKNPKDGSKKRSATSLPQSLGVLLVPYDAEACSTLTPMEVLPMPSGRSAFRVRFFLFQQHNHEDTCNFETMKTCTCEKQNASSNASLCLPGRLYAFRGALVHFLFFLFWNWSCSTMVSGRCSKVTAFQGALPRPSEGLRLETSTLEAEAHHFSDLRDIRDIRVAWKRENDFHTA